MTPDCPNCGNDEWFNTTDESGEWVAECVECGFQLMDNGDSHD